VRSARFVVSAANSDAAAAPPGGMKAKSVRIGTVGIALAAKAAGCDGTKPTGVGCYRWSESFGETPRRQADLPGFRTIPA
jgi:hypothetical protein